AGSLAISSNFYEPLMTSDPTMTLRPCLAATWETPDPLTWVFHLRHGVRFHSGRPMRAAAVVYSFVRLRENPSLELSIYPADVANVEALDEFTVRVRTLAPVAILLFRLQYISIVPAGSTSDALAAGENGTGPYRLEEWRRHESIRLR